jgi:quercetin dioxygenase-like cupin family protein
MPVIANADAREVPWRPGYRNFVLAGREEGLSCVAGYSTLEPGAGAPLHVHADVDEVFIVLEGSIEFTLGEERVTVGPEHTVAIPAGVKHAFRALGPEPARMFTFMPRNRAIAEATTYFEGAAPKGAGEH